MNFLIGNTWRKINITHNDRVDYVTLGTCDASTFAQPRDHISTGSHCYLNKLCPMISTFVTFDPYTTSEGYSLSLLAILFVRVIVSIY